MHNWFVVERLKRQQFEEMIRAAEQQRLIRLAEGRAENPVLKRIAGQEEPRARPRRPATV